MKAACALTVALGAVLRWWNVARPLAPMEQLTADESVLPFSTLLHRLTHFYGIADPPIFTLGVNLWDGAFGSSALSLHAFSALIGTAALAAAYWAGKEAAGPRAGWAAAAVAALHPTVLAYGSEARSYGLLLTLELLALGALARARRTGRSRDWAFFAGLVLAACWTHYFGLFFAAALLALGALAQRRGEGPTRAGWAWAGGAAALYLVWIPVLLRHAEHPSMAFEPLEPLRALGATTGASLRVEHLAGGWLDEPWLSLAVLACVGVSAALALRAPKEDRPALAALAACGLAVLGLSVAVSLIYPILSWGRHVNAALPPLILFWGWALARTRPPKAALAAAALLLPAAPSLYAAVTGRRTRVADVAARTAEVARPGDALIVRPLARRRLIAASIPARAALTLCKGRLPPRAVVLYLAPMRRPRAAEACEWSVLRRRYRRVSLERFAPNIHLYVYDRIDRK